MRGWGRFGSASQSEADSIWTPVAFAPPRQPSKCPEMELRESASASIAYEIRTKSPESSGLEKDGWRERNLGPGGQAAVLRLAPEAPQLLGFSTRSKRSENVDSRGTGGGSATGIQRSLNL